MNWFLKKGFPSWDGFQFIFNNKQYQILHKGTVYNEDMLGMQLTGDISVKKWATYPLGLAFLP
jgi:hypothetical protein